VLSARLHRYYGRLRRPPGQHPLPGVTGYRAPCFRQQHTAACRAGEGLPSSRRHCPNVSHPLRRGVPRGCLPGSSPLCVAFTVVLVARLSLAPPHGGYVNGAAGFASCYGPSGCFPHGAFDAGLRRRAFPPDAASLLPGLLAATRTGLPPASDGELATDDQPLHPIDLQSLGAQNSTYSP
jgi:hypothetical protein